jgi:hypothetical protein
VPIGHSGDRRVGDASRHGAATEDPEVAVQLEDDVDGTARHISRSER